MTYNDAILTATYFIFAFVFSSFLEYWIHRLMHTYAWVGNRLTPHYSHHRNNQGVGVIWEFRNYCVVAIFVLPAFLISLPVGIKVLCGSLFYAAFSAYAHQLQHDNPRKCFWMKMPVHYIHHKHNQWDHNFGLALDWWDFIFGTYKAEEWPTEVELSQPELGRFQIKWW